MSKTIVTHNSTFHSDDVFAVSTLLLKYPGSTVIRTRDPQIIDAADFAVDVGMTHDPLQGRFDHHQPGGAGKRSNGIPYASFGLVWKEFGPDIAGQDVWERIDQMIAAPLDAHDNGVAIADYRFEGVREYTLGDFLYSFLTHESDHEANVDRIFMELLVIGQDLLKREIEKMKDVVEGEKEVVRIYNESKNKSIIILDKELPWQRVLMEMPETFYVVYPRRDKTWGAKCVTDEKKGFGSQRKPFPLEWGGKTHVELQALTGVPDAIFAHNSHFMVAATSKEGVIALAEKALSA